MKKKILYVHGMSSSGSSSTARTLKELLSSYSECIEILSPDIPIEPKIALQTLKELCEQEKPDLIIGTSMGGMFTQQLFGYKKVLINPAFHVSKSMRTKLGHMAFLNPRKDGATYYEITEKMCDDCQEMEAHQFEGITEFDTENTYGFFGINDVVVNCYDEFCQYYKKAFKFDGGHRPSVENIKELIEKIIIRILDKK